MPGNGSGVDATDIQRRIRAWRRSGDLLALWPHLDRGRLARAHRAIHRTIEAVLDRGRDGQEGPDEREQSPVLDAGADPDLGALDVAAFLSGSGPLLGCWIERGVVRAPPAVAERLGGHLEHGRRRTSMLQARLATIATALRSDGVDPLVLKGLHTGAVYFPEPGARTGADIDLLVPPEQRERAARVLDDLGYVEARRTEYGARSEWRLPSEHAEVRSLELDHADNPWSLDLHTGLGRWYFRGLRRNLGVEAFQSRERIVFGDTGVRVLSQPYLAAFLALHASHDVVKTRLVRLVELALVCHRDVASGTLDWADLAAVLRRTRTRRFVYPALALTERLAPGTVDAAVLAEVTAASTERARRVVAAVAAGGMFPLLDASLDAKLMWARGPKQKLMNASEILVPSDDGLGVGAGRLLVRRIAAVIGGRARMRPRPGLNGVESE